MTILRQAAPATGSARKSAPENAVEAMLKDTHIRDQILLSEAQQ
jgi:hypothetical protein